MSFQDKSLQCSDCGQEFIFTAGEQEFYASRGLQHEPKRCPQCRQARKAQRSGSGGDNYTSRY
jgi:DNA-directed RNA polymerase subunit RPC12/RpoP